MKKILIIEDNNDIRDNTAEILELSNYQVITAKDGKAGLEQALLHIPDLILCDIMMPVLDGYGVLHAVQKNKSLNETPFIFLTAKTERTDFRKGMELGADDYITKPFTGTELLNAVDIRLRKTTVSSALKTSGLDTLRFLIKIPPHEIESTSFEGICDINSYKKKQIIYSEGNHPYNMYFIIKGKVKIAKKNEEGKVLITDMLSPGDFFGYVAMLEGDLHHNTAETLEETELAVIPKEDFDELITHDAMATKRFVQILARNISQREEQLMSVAYHSLRKKVADALIMLKNKYPQPDQQVFTINISRENLATLAGTATESLIRTLTEFSNEKIIDLNNGSITLLNEHRLINLVN